jgi:hypothetical protein
VAYQKGFKSAGVKKPNIPIPLIAIAVTTITYITISSELESVSLGEIFCIRKFKKMRMMRKKMAPIRSAVDVISVTPVSISEFDTQKHATGISNIPIITERKVIFFKVHV